MRPDSVAPHRPPPDPIDRTTRLGADQYVLACNARRDASDLAFNQILLLEHENARLRAEVEWKVAHASTRTGIWVWGRVIVVTCILAGLAGIGGWMFTSNGREFRSGVAEGFQTSGNRAP